MTDALARTYQTHESDSPGFSDSLRTLERIALPADLTGKSVLDLGCNEGFFCGEAARRGAKSVIGIDVDRAALETAKRLYGSKKVKFVFQDWESLPEGRFDIVLWISGMHYELDPASVTRRIAALLRSGGLFILECGVLDWPQPEMVLFSRHSDSRWYPTAPLLDSWLSDYSARRIGSPASIDGDPVPRAVFHCFHRRPTVVLIRGKSRRGKTGLAASIADSATKVVSLDAFVTRIAVSPYHHTALHELIRDRYDSKDLSKIYYAIDESDLSEEYARLVAESVAPSDRLVVIEGLLTDPQAEALQLCLSERALVWDVERLPR
jgi:SAM-dependent methyltransferase